MFKGVFTAIITPFKDNGDIDELALRKLIDFQLENGIHGLVPMGTTGESPTLTHDEHIEAIRIVTEQVKGKVPIIAGTGSNCTREAVNLTKKAKDLGVTASLQVAPYYNKPTQEGFYAGKTPEYYRSKRSERKYQPDDGSYPGQTRIICRSFR